MSILLSGGEIFSLAMEVEKSGYAFYKTVADSTSNSTLKQLFDFLADQEIHHYEFFKSLNAEVGEITVSDEEWEATSEYIKASVDSRFFIGEDKAIAAAQNVTDPVNAVEVAIGFEKDTLLFFYELLNVTPEKSKDSARKIIEEEKRHILMLTEKKKLFTS